MHTGPGCTSRASSCREAAQQILLKVSSPHSTTLRTQNFNTDTKPWAKTALQS